MDGTMKDLSDMLEVVTGEKFCFFHHWHYYTYQCGASMYRMRKCLKCDTKMVLVDLGIGRPKWTEFDGEL
jgi:hypothetical protein